MTAAAATNVQIAEAIGMTDSGVSRIRSGDRLPSVAKMVEIEAAFKWSVSDQVRARSAGKYAAKFEEKLADHYGAATRTIDVQASA